MAWNPFLEATDPHLALGTRTRAVHNTLQFSISKSLVALICATSMRQTTWSVQPHAWLIKTLQNAASRYKVAQFVFAVGA